MIANAIDVEQSKRDCRRGSLRDRILRIDGVTYCLPCGRRIVVERRPAKPSSHRAWRTVVRHVGLWTPYRGC